jgi:hypothetical protein
MNLESLETRRLMSVTIASDRAAVVAALGAQASEAASVQVTLLADQTAMAGFHARKNATSHPLFETLHADDAKWAKTLAIDVHTELSRFDTAEATVNADAATVIADKSTGAEAAAKTALTNAKIAAQTALANGLTQRLADRASAAAALSADENAIITALPSSGLSANAQAAVTKFCRDKGTGFADVTTDIQTVLTDRQTLIAALQASLA